MIAIKYNTSLETSEHLQLNVDSIVQNQPLDTNPDARLIRIIIPFISIREDKNQFSTSMFSSHTIGTVSHSEIKNNSSKLDIHSIHQIYLLNQMLIHRYHYYTDIILYTLRQPKIVLTARQQQGQKPPPHPPPKKQYS